MPLYRKKSQPVEAMQWMGGDTVELRQWLGYAFVDITTDGVLLIENRDGRVWCNYDDWIVKDDGFYPVEPIKFHAEYEAAT